jgi:hypothetical protein
MVIEKMTEVMKIRGKCCKKIIKAASLNDVWNMRRYQFLNTYLSKLQPEQKKKPRSDDDIDPTPF